MVCFGIKFTRGWLAVVNYYCQCDQMESHLGNTHLLYLWRCSWRDLTVMERPVLNISGAFSEGLGPGPNKDRVKENASQAGAFIALCFLSADVT